VYDRDERLNEIPALHYLACYRLHSYLLPIGVGGAQSTLAGREDIFAGKYV